MSIKSCNYVAGIKYSHKKNVKGGEQVKTKVPGLNWTPSLPARKARALKAMGKLENIKLAAKLLAV